MASVTVSCRETWWFKCPVCGEHRWSIALKDLAYETHDRCLTNDPYWVKTARETHADIYGFMVDNFIWWAPSIDSYVIDPEQRLVDAWHANGCFGRTIPEAVGPNGPTTWTTTGFARAILDFGLDDTPLGTLCP